MINRNVIVLLLCLMVISLTPSCKKHYSTDSDTTDLTDDSSGSEEEADYTWQDSDIIPIQLNGSSATADNAGVAIAGSKVTINAAGTYSLTGSLTDGQLLVDTQDDELVRLIFRGVDIRCSNSAPVYIKNAGKVLIVLSDGTENYLKDGSSYILDSDGEPNAAVFSKSYLSFFGKGSLTITANYNDGITGKDGLVIRSGSLFITSTDDGIRGKDYLHIERGNITINSKGDGLKSDNESDAAMGYITIDSAIVNITASAGDGISAINNLKIADGSITITTGGGASTSTTSTGGGFGGGSSGGYNGTVSEKALKAGSTLKIDKGTFVINSADDAIHSNGIAEINGGTFTIASGDDAIHAESAVTINDGLLNISRSYEGFESAAITINNGTINLVATDDALNATKGLAAGGTENNDGSSLDIKGGTIMVNTSSGDGLDSNGNASVSGGTIIVHGPSSQPEVGFDINGSFNISGGFLIGTGPNSGNMIEAPSTTSTQYSVKATASSTLSSSTLFHIQDADGKDLVTFKPVRTVYYLIFSSPELTNGASYSLYTGGAYSLIGVNGLYAGGTYSGGTLKKTFTLSSRITSVSF